MKRWMCLGAAALLASFCASVAIGAPDQGKKGRAPKEKKQEQILKGMYAELAKEVKLDAAQTKMMEEALKAKTEAVKAWQGDPAKGGKLAEWAKQLKNPEVRGNKQKAKEMRDQMKPLEAELRALEAKHDAAIIAILTPQQKQAWEIAVLFRTLAAPMKRAQLTEEQRAKIRDLYTAAAKRVAALKPEDEKGKAAIMKELRKSADALLTPEQKEKMKRPPKQKAQV